MVFQGKDWLDSSGRFLFGKYRGSSVEEIVSDDPDYLHWILDTVTDISREDRQIIASIYYRYN